MANIINAFTHITGINGSYIHVGYSLVTPRYRYTEFVRLTQVVRGDPVAIRKHWEWKPEFVELFDLGRDPWENVNVAGEAR